MATGTEVAVLGNDRVGSDLDGSNTVKVDSRANHNVIMQSQVWRVPNDRTGGDVDPLANLRSKYSKQKAAPLLEKTGGRTKQKHPNKPPHQPQQFVAEIKFAFKTFCCCFCQLTPPKGVLFQDKYCANSFSLIRHHVYFSSTSFLPF